ncbi:MAG: hypothetical protein K2X11_04895 [Acetobacteraceae bacterium]|nr:hypothetical protein [Acetobacteraceae bacterium]
MIIARRVLASAQGDVTVTLFAPVADGEDMRCEYVVDGAAGSWHAHAVGVDGFQAMDLAQRRIGAELRAREESVGPIRWLDREDTGFAALWWTSLPRNTEAHAFYAALGAEEDVLHAHTLEGEAFTRLARQTP